MARLLSARIRLLALDPGQYEESCKLEWPDYSQDHPDTDKTKGQYVQECVERKENQQTKRDEKDEAKPEAGAGSGGGEPPTEKSVDDMNPEERGALEDKIQENMDVSKEDAKALADADVSPDIDPDDLNNAIDHILKEKQPEKKPWHEKLVDVTEFLMSLTDVDDFVLGLPDKAKSWADHLHKKVEENKKRQKETVKELIDHGISYDEYVKRQRATEINIFKQPMPKDQWDALEAELEKEDRAEETKKQLKEKKEPGSSKEDKGKDEKPKSKKDEKSEKPESKPDKKQDEKNLRPRKPATQDTIDSFDPNLEDKHVDYIQGLERNRQMPDDEFMRRALAKGSPEFRRRMKDMDPKEFREFYEALWAETQP